MTLDLSAMCDELRDANRKLLRPRRILLIEDEPTVQFLFVRAARPRNCVVECASDGIEGEAMAMAGNYDLLCIDQRLPHRPGLEVFRHIVERTPDHPPVVFFSGFIDFDLTAAAAKIAFAAWVPKTGNMDAAYFAKMFETFGIKTRAELGLPEWEDTDAAPPSEPTL